MKRFILITFLALAMVSTSFAAGGDKDNADDLLRKSRMPDPDIGTSFPFPFNETSNQRTDAAVSTGYYFVDSYDDAPAFWRPEVRIEDPDRDDPELWHRIQPGPRILVGSDGNPETYWEENPEEGLAFFRNPALPGVGGQHDFFDYPPDPNNPDYDPYATDSTDDAFAGPIPINFAFYFNGLRFDSFYVSTNGLVALTNKRYIYDNNGNRTIPDNATTAYDPMSMDWFHSARSRSGNGLLDSKIDDFGYRYVACGNNENSRYAGLRANGPGSGLQSFINNSNKAHVIAPFWGSLHMSQFDDANNVVDGFAEVQYKRNRTNDKLIIYIRNIGFDENVLHPITKAQSVSNPPNRRPGTENTSFSSAQVILNAVDSSVTILFENFVGGATFGYDAFSAEQIFRANTTCGVGGFARHVNYKRDGYDPNATWAGEYMQITHYYNAPAGNMSYPASFFGIKFRQYKNVLRVVDIQYHVRDKDKDATLDFYPEGCDDCVIKTTEVGDYELLAGEERIGAIQPVALLQNLTNDVQGPRGVNFQQQDLNFRGRFRIINLANNKIVYNRLVPVDSTCLDLPEDNAGDCTGDPYVRVRLADVSVSSGNYSADKIYESLPTDNGHIDNRKMNGIPPYGFVQIKFPPFEPNVFLDNHIGRMRAYIIGDPTDPQSGESLGDQWPFDDTSSVRLFVMRRLEDFKDDVTEYHVVERTEMPSVLKWVNIGANVVSGDEVSYHPLPPRGEYRSANYEFFPSTIFSPVIHMDRYNLAGTDWNLLGEDGDEIRSFPIDLRKSDEKKDPVLSVSFQRATRRETWDRDWCFQSNVGPEPRSFLNNDELSWFGRYYQGGTYTYSAALSYNPDQIVVEFMRPSPDAIQFITNVEDDRWRYHENPESDPIEDMPAYLLWGSNGYSIGFLEENKDSSLAPAQLRNPRARNAYRPNLFDDGIDFEYVKAFIPIPNQFLDAPNEGAKNFRFRIRVMAQNDQKCTTCNPDDQDDFYVDNVKILFAREVTDIEVSAVKARWQYTIAPATQATKIPITVKLSNNTAINSPAFDLKVKIFKGSTIRNPWEVVYCRTKTVSSMPARIEVEEQMPSWNAREFGPGTYTVVANVIVPGGDLEELNDTTYSQIQLQFGDVFAYDPPNATNDVPSTAFTGVAGRGLNTYGYAYGGQGRATGFQAGTYSNPDYQAGVTGGSGSGQFAVKFVLLNQDTIYGYQAYFGPLNMAPDDISLSIYTDRNGVLPGQEIKQSQIYKQRGVDDVRKDRFWDEYVTYLLPSPLILPAGTYWAVIAQLAETGIELGASKTRMGMRTTNTFVPPPVTFTNDIGAAGNHLMIEDNYRVLKNEVYVNDNFFAFENTRLSGQWSQFMPTAGNPAYAFLDHFGVSDGTTATLSRGGWIPMIRPYLKAKSYGNLTDFRPCYDDSLLIPVELVTFNASKRSNGIDLSWETASEQNNYGFHVERTVVGEDEGNWSDVGFVKGAGNSTSLRSYSFHDSKVMNGRTYQYRLRQVDLDGSQTCHISDVVTIKFDNNFDIALEQNAPNPFSAYTRIAFTLPESMDVKLEILDIYGNVVSTLVNDNLPALRHEYNWEGRDMSGAQVANGTYIYRLTAGEKVLSGKMTLIK